MRKNNMSFGEMQGSNQLTKEMMIDAGLFGTNAQGRSMKVNRLSSDWIATKMFVEEEMQNHMQTLRNVSIDHGQTQYARGAMDALESLLRFGGEEV